VSHRPLAIVSGLTIGDYLLWNWSLNGSHDVLALVSGLTLPPLAAAFLWLIALTGARLLARTRRPGARKATRAARPAARPMTTATKGRRTGLPRRFSGRRAAWLGELREARTIVAEATASRTHTPSPTTPAASQPQAQQTSASKRSRSSRKIAA
jgi:hypothetical protein